MIDEAVETATQNRSEGDLLAEIEGTEAARLTVNFFRMLAETHSEKAAVHACLRYLVRNEGAPGTRHAAEWIANGSTYMPLLFDPDFLPMEEARRAANICRHFDTRFLPRLQQLLTAKETPARIVLHALSVLALLEEGDTFVPLLRILTHSENERIRSSATKTLCKLRPNRMLIERQLQSPDPRMRANAIESLWHLKTTEAADIFRTATTDPHHRVAINALVGLCYQNDRIAFDRLLELARHESPLFRAAAIWAFSHLGDPRAIPALEKLSQDPRPFVRKKAAEALARLQASSKNSEDSTKS